MKNKTLFYFTVMILLSLLMGAYSGHFHNPFHFDDEHTIVTNEYIRDLSNIPRFFTDASTTSSLPANQAYRPGLTTLNAIDYALAGRADPFYFHLSIFSAYLILLMMLYLMLLKISDVIEPGKKHHWLALLTTAFYGLHPANAETINYIIARSDSFSTLMVIIGMNVYLYFPKKRKYQLYLLPMTMGFFVKEPALMLIPLVFFYHLLIGRFETAPLSNKKTNRLFRSIIHVLPGLAVGCGLFLFSRSMTPDSWKPTNISTANYLLTQPFVIVHYFNNFILPVNLVADTDWSPVSNPFDDRVFAGLAFILTIIALLFFCMKYRHWLPLSFGMAWFLIALMPTSSIFPLGEVLNDHRTFFPYIGLAMAAGWSVYRMYAGLGRFKKLLVAIVCCCIFTLQSWGVYQRCSVWSSEETLWYDVTLKAPQNARGLMNYGNVLMSKGKYDEALTYFQNALKLWPYYSYLHTNMGILLGAMGKDKEAENYFLQAQKLGPMNPEVYFYYGRWLMEKGRMDEARKQIHRCLEISPGHLLAQSLQKTLENISQYKPGNALGKALAQTERNPSPESFLYLSLVYYNAGNYMACIHAAEKALELKPDYAPAYNNICSAYNELHQWEAAINACNRALAIQPDYALASNNLKVAVNGKQEDEKNK